MAKKIQIAVTYLFEYEEEELTKRFDGLETEAEFKNAARLMLWDQNMNECTPDYIEIDIIED